MKTNKDDGVFALSCVQTGATNVGLTKREYFAAMAMQGMLTHVSKLDASQWCTEMAVRYADALIAELNKQNKQDV